jgi:serine/threonine protein kinase
VCRRPCSPSINVAGNLLLSKNHTLKLADFGVSHLFEAAGSDVLRSTAGTAAFQAPEMLSGGTFSGMKADMWACGMTLFMCVHGHPAFMVRVFVSSVTVANDTNFNCRNCPAGFNAT